MHTRKNISKKPHVVNNPLFTYVDCANYPPPVNIILHLFANKSLSRLEEGSFCMPPIPAWECENAYHDVECAFTRCDEPVHSVDILFTRCGEPVHAIKYHFTRCERYSHGVECCFTRCEKPSHVIDTLFTIH